MPFLSQVSARQSQPRYRYHIEHEYRESRAGRCNESFHGRDILYRIDGRIFVGPISRVESLCREPEHIESRRSVSEPMVGRLYRDESREPTRAESREPKVSISRAESRA
jgi:hypothetical protein